MLTVHYASLAWVGVYGEGGQVWEGYSTDPDHLLNLLQDAMKPLAEHWHPRKATESDTRRPEMAWSSPLASGTYYAAFGTLKLLLPTSENAPASA